jgi:hypothetical protein
VKITGYYEVVPVPGGKDEGWHVTRNGHVLKWHPDRIGAVIEAVCKAVDESQTGVRTRLCIMDAAGRVGHEWSYPREPVSLRRVED